MDRTFEQDLEKARQELIRMGSLVEEMLENAIKAFEQRDTARAETVIRADRAVDEIELSIQKHCQLLLALRQPLATDLRFLLSAVQMTTDLERIGDCSGNIAQSLIEVHREPVLETLPPLMPLANSVRQMLRQALDAFVREDESLARSTWENDDVVDDLYSEIFAALEELMKTDRSAVNRSLHMLLIARHLERIGDHASNLCEEAVYFMTGLDIRHSRTEYEPQS